MLDIYDAGQDGYRMFIDAGNNILIKKEPLVAHCTGTAVSTNFNGPRPISTKQVSSKPVNFNMWNDCQPAFMHTRQCAVSLANATEYSSSNNSWANASSAATSQWACEQSYNYFLNIHSRNGWDGASAGINIYHDTLFCATTGCTPNNPFNASFSSGTMQVGNNGNTNTIDDWNTLDIIAHEFTHGVTGSSAGLVYSKESGALNESFSDIFGVTCYAWFSGLNANTWLIGFDRKSPFNTDLSLYIRNMANPNNRSHPDTYLGTNWQSTAGSVDPGDNWGVHINSGVQNFMYYLLVSGGAGKNDNSDTFNVSGIGITKARTIAYRALTVGYLNANSQYEDARNAWVHATVDLYGACSYEAIQTGKAWAAVGLLPPLSGVTDICGTFGPVVSTVYTNGGFLNVADNCDVTVTDTNYVQFGARLVMMHPGFIAKAGSNFKAVAMDCDYAAY